MAQPDVGKLMLRSQAEVPISRRSLLTAWTLPLALCLSLSRPKSAHAFTRQTQRSVSTRRTPHMSYTFGKSITQQPRGTHSATVIFLHGLGDTGNGWAPVGQQLNIPHVKFVFPTAPTRQALLSMLIFLVSCLSLQRPKPESKI